jgi:hypothetical protein
MGIAARKLAEQQYDRALGTGKFAKLLAAVYSGKPAAPTPEPETVEARGLRAPAIPKN